MALTDWTPAGIPAIASRYGGAGNLGWWFVVNTNGTLGLRWSSDGTAFTDATSTVAPTVADGAALWVRAPLPLSNSNVKFYTSTDGTTWTQLGTTVVLNADAATTLFASTWQYEVGTRSAGAYLLNGKVYEVRICAGRRTRRGAIHLRRVG